MQALVDRLQRALSPQFTILREIAGGGMGRVFLAQDQALDRPVAIKVLRPELATALGAERFLREARLLARLRHPNILPVFQGGEADGLLYHVLEYQDGETLAQRLKQGPLGKDEWSRLAEGLLSALEAAHAAGVVHRDIKPSNIFLVQDRVVVGDFGIAHTDTTGDPLTESGSLLGTRAYMAPEQLRGAATTPQTDLYSAARVLVEAASGRRLDAPAPGSAGLWAGVPRRLVKPLRRALSEDPADRWQSALAMQAALHGRGQRWWLIPAAAAAALLAWVLWPPPEPPDYFVLRLERLELVGAGPAVPWHDSVRAALAERLRGFPDFVVDTEGDSPYTLSISGSVVLRGDSLRADLYTRAGKRTTRLLVAPTVSSTDWRPLVDTLTNAVFRTIWLEHAGEFGSLPYEALPGTTQGTERWLRAEFSYSDGNWQAARQAYEEAVSVDPSCLLCAYRIMDLDRWLAQPVDSVRLWALQANLGRFPEDYRSLIIATSQPPGARIDSLRALVARRPRFFDARYLLGDELLHRGPLVGMSREQAIEQLREARRLRPDFAGVAEHLAWALIVEGERDSSRAVLDELESQHKRTDHASAALRAFHELAWRWRFHSGPEAAGATTSLLATPDILESAYLPAGPRSLPALGVPEGALGFGLLMAEITSRPELVRSGLVAGWLGATGLGQYRAANRAAARLREMTPDPVWRITPLQLAALRQALGELVPEEAAAGPALQSLADRPDQLAGIKDRARWSLAVNGQLTIEPGDTTAAGRLQRAVAHASAGQPGHALLVLDSATTGNLHPIDPTAAAAVWLLRATWFGAIGRHAEAATELLKFEHSDFPGLPSGELQGAEIDWALGTLAMWRRAGHLEAAEESGRELCRLYADVARRWAGGDPVPAARADSARARAAALRCGVAR